MYCRRCGKAIPDGSINCPYCGERQQNVGFVEALQSLFTNVVNFTGRATRAEYWWAMLFIFGVNMLALFLSDQTSNEYVFIITCIALWLPQLSVTIRRLHDIGKPWMYWLYSLIPFTGYIIIVYYCVRISDADNRWGPAYRGGF